MGRTDDKTKKLIIADRVSGESIRAIARKYNISTTTVQRIIKSDGEVTQKVTQKQIENTQDTLSYMASQHETKKRIADKLLSAMEKKAETVDMFTSVKDMATAYGILVDKELKFAEVKAGFGEQQQKYTGLPARVLGREWVDINRSIDEREYYQYDLKGGRGSLKSSFCGLKIIDLIELNPTWCGLCIKQQKIDIGTSVYSQVVWAIDELGLTEQYYCTKSPFEIKKKSTGQVIYFRAGNEPSKIKSLRPPNGMHIGVVWVEEADQIHGADALRMITQSAFRGGDEGLLFRSYNTPISAQHYINVEERKPNPRRFIHHSHFMNAPKAWLGKLFWEEAEALKQSNERAYRHEYDGEATGTGAQVFENVTIRQITDDELRTFDRLYYGLDFGYYPDPLHFCECYFNASQRKLYIFGEIRKYKTRNEDLAVALDPWRKVKIIADSAEPKSIADLQSWGFNMFGAIKGPGSVEYSMKWLQSLTEIIIDPVRCPPTAEEFQTYEYERTKDGELISGYPDKNCHAIDSVRYALEEIWRRRGQ